MDHHCHSSSFDANVIVPTSSLSSTCSSSSSSLQEFAFYNYLSNLSPLTSLKANQIFPEANIRTTAPVFRSPRIDLRQESNFPPRDDSIKAGSKKEPQSSFSDQAAENVSLRSQSANSAVHQGYDANQASSQHHHGTRRHLQFEAATAYKGTTFGDGNSLCSSTHDKYSNMMLSAKPRNFEELPSPSGPLFSSCLFESHRYTQNVGHVVSFSKKFEGQLSIGDNHMLNRNNGLANETSNLPVAATHMDNDLAIRKVRSAASHPIGPQIEPCDTSMPASQDSERVQVVNFKKKRSRKKATLKKGGCKNCNCKKSRCLKLYCDCFAAGAYCIDSCACKNCFNKPEYVDIIVRTRQQIETRNSLAFAPKVTNSPTKVEEELNWSTSSSARHKRGCNCKKSTCLKKYCECYGAKVGCYESCRCENCKNSYGRKADRVNKRTQRWISSNEKKVETLNTEVDGIGIQNKLSPTWEGLVDISNLTPLSDSPPSDSWTLSNVLDYSSILQPHSYLGSQFQPSAGSSFHLHSSPIHPNQKVHNNYASGLNASLYDMNNKENIPLMIIRNMPHLQRQRD